MAEDNIHKQEFAVRDLGTRSVTLCPSRAHVIRDINDINLQPGANEITIYGITPTADESSIKVEGIGSATITEMTVDLVVNQEHYEDVYPSESEDSDDDEDDLSDSEAENEGMKKYLEQAEKLNGLIREANDQQLSANSRLNILEQFGQAVAKSKPENMSKAIGQYKEERQRIFDDDAASTARQKKLLDDRSNLGKEYRRVRKEVEKAGRKSEKAKAKKSAEKRRVRQEKFLAKQRLREERVFFWPKKVYRVVLSLETNTDMTPGSSRRGSVSSLVKPSSPNGNLGSIAKGSSPTEGSSQIGMVISYVTYSASWSPRYDLNLTTPTQSGTVIYRAEFHNKTSESWRDAKVILSTSQTAFQGLGESIPTLEPWHISLAKGNGNSSMDDAQYSRSEIQRNYKGPAVNFNRPQEPRDALFGLKNINDSTRKQMQRQVAFANPQPLPSSTFGAPAAGPQVLSQFSLNDRRYGDVHANAHRSSGLFGGSGIQQASIGPKTATLQNLVQQQQQQQTQRQIAFANPQPLPSSPFGAPAVGPQVLSQFSDRGNYGDVDANAHCSSSLFGGSGIQQASFGPQLATLQNLRAVPTGVAEPVPGLDFDSETIVPRDATIEFEESSWEETGLTATYDVPGLRTIRPSHLTRRHRIASLTFKEIQLSYVLIPKLRQAAFLKARLRNTSSITLLKGPAGLTLDGSFLGNATLPRCSAGEAFNLNLGIDPGINVVYQKPAVHRSQSGFLQKEGSCVFTRSVIVTNTKGNSVLEGFVLDQVPVSEDDKLKVDVLQPRGLRNERDEVRSGVAVSVEAVKHGSARDSVTSVNTQGTQGKGDKWGRAVASMKKAGEIRWDLKLNPGQAVRLVLEYETRYPSSDRIVGM